VALIDKAKDINILLPKKSIVGLVGMRGIGKTICAKNYIICSTTNMTNLVFLEDVKSKDNINDVIKQLLHDLRGKRLCKDENVNKKNLDQIKQCMISQKVLMVVNDVGKGETLHPCNLSLIKLPRMQLLKEKNKVFMNCQNWQILKSHVNEDGKMVMKSLEEE
jgi:hypothetical protein